jgi:hypothetical protein
MFLEILGVGSLLVKGFESLGEWLEEDRAKEDVLEHKQYKVEMLLNKKQAKTFNKTKNADEMRRIAGRGQRKSALVKRANLDK